MENRYEGVMPGGEDPQETEKNCVLLPNFDDTIANSICEGRSESKPLSQKETVNMIMEKIDQLIDIKFKQADEQRLHCDGIMTADTNERAEENVFVNKVSIDKQNTKTNDVFSDDTEAISIMSIDSNEASCDDGDSDKNCASPTGIWQNDFENIRKFSNLTTESNMAITDGDKILNVEGDSEIDDVFVANQLLIEKYHKIDVEESYKIGQKKQDFVVQATSFNDENNTKDIDKMSNSSLQTAATTIKSCVDADAGNFQLISVSGNCTVTGSSSFTTNLMHGKYFYDDDLDIDIMCHDVMRKLSCPSLVELSTESTNTQAKISEPVMKNNKSKNISKLLRSEVEGQFHINTSVCQKEMSNDNEQQVNNSNLPLSQDIISPLNDSDTPTLYNRSASPFKFSSAAFDAMDGSDAQYQFVFCSDQSTPATDVDSNCEIFTDEEYNIENVCEDENSFHNLENKIDEKIVQQDFFSQSVEGNRSVLNLADLEESKNSEVTIGDDIDSVNITQAVDDFNNLQQDFPKLTNQRSLDVTPYYNIQCSPEAGTSYDNNVVNITISEEKCEPVPNRENYLVAESDTPSLSVEDNLQIEKENKISLGPYSREVSLSESTFYNTNEASIELPSLKTVTIDHFVSNNTTPNECSNDILGPNCDGYAIQSAIFNSTLSDCSSLPASYVPLTEAKSLTINIYPNPTTSTITTPSGIKSVASFPNNTKAKTTNQKRKASAKTVKANKNTALTIKNKNILNPSRTRIKEKQSCKQETSKNINSRDCSLGGSKTQPPTKIRSTRTQRGTTNLKSEGQDSQRRLKSKVTNKSKVLTTKKPDVMRRKKKSQNTASRCLEFRRSWPPMDSEVNFSKLGIKRSESFESGMNNLTFIGQTSVKLNKRTMSADRTQLHFAVFPMEIKIQGGKHEQTKSGSVTSGLTKSLTSTKNNAYKYMLKDHGKINDSARKHIRSVSSAETTSTTSRRNTTRRPNSKSRETKLKPTTQTQVSCKTNSQGKKTLKEPPRQIIHLKSLNAKVINTTNNETKRFKETTRNSKLEKTVIKTKPKSPSLKKKRISLNNEPINAKPTRKNPPLYGRSLYKYNKTSVYTPGEKSKANNVTTKRGELYKDIHKRKKVSFVVCMCNCSLVTVF